MTDCILKIDVPNYDWRLIPSEGWEINFESSKRKIPNAFHRYMQLLVFGFKWEKIT